MAIAIELTDQQYEALAQKARRLQLSEADLATAVVRELVTQEDADFDVAAQRVLAKNQELYRRLA